jgi:hypothetical protein
MVQLYLLLVLQICHWLIDCNWVQGLAALMHLGLNWWALCAPVDMPYQYDISQSKKLIHYWLFFVLCIMVFEFIVYFCLKFFMFNFSRCIFNWNIFTDVKLFPSPLYSVCFLFWLLANSVVFKMQPNISYSVLLVIDASFSSKSYAFTKACH